MYVTTPLIKDTLKIVILGKYEEPKPAWIEAEKEFFLRERDKDGDGKLNKVRITDSKMCASCDMNLT